MILTTNNKFEVLDYSQNLLKYLQIPKDDEILQNGEFLGNKLNISSIINHFHDIMIDHVGESYYSPQHNHSILSVICTTNAFD